MLISGKKLLEKAYTEGYAVGQFNFLNLEVLQGIMEAAAEEKSPVIIATTEGAIKYARIPYLYHLAKAASETYPDVPITLHLDHGKDFAIIQACIKAGWTSIMFDGSSLPFEENMAKTKEVVKLCKRKGIGIEAELGVLAGVEDDVSAEHNKYTDVEQAVTFAKKTGCTSLAIAIGTSHGAYKFKGDSNIDIERLKEIKARVSIPLVLHGASGVYADLVTLAESYGANLKGASGVSDEMIRLATANGINKINCDTDLRISFMTGIRQTFKEHPEDFDVRSFCGNGKKMVREMVKRRMILFGSAGRI